MAALDVAIVEAEQERTARQIESPEAVVVDGTELTSIDDEQGPEGATIAYEREPARCCVKPGADRNALLVTPRQLLDHRQVICVDCGRAIDLERIAALPTASRCVHCAA